MMEKVSIIVPFYLDGKSHLGEYLMVCTESITLHTLVDYELFLMNNGGYATEEAHLLEFQVDRLVNVVNCKNIFRIPSLAVNFSRICNLGAERSSSDSEFLVFLNSDTVVGPGWLETMIETYHLSPKTGVVGVWSNEIGGVQSIKLQSMSDGAYYTKLVKGVCMMVRREDFFKVGKFDEEYKKWYQDDDLSMKFYSSGYHNVIAPTFVMHFGSMTFKALGIDLENDLEIKEDAKRFKEKWADQFRGSMA